MNLNALSLFVSVVQDGSLSKASERLNVPISTISRQITELEKSLNIQLFDRKKSGVKPTMAGQKLYEQVYQNIDNLLQVEKAFSEHQEISGTLRISTFTGLEEVWAWLDEFGAKYPKVSIHCQVTDRVWDLVEDNIDFTFRTGDLHTDNAVARLVLTAKVKCVAHPHLLAQYGTPTTPDDLVRFPCVGFAKAQQKHLSIQLENKTLHLPYVFASNDVYAIAYFIQQGRGVGYLSENIANRLIEEYGLVEVLHDYPMRTYPVHLLYLKHRYPSSVMRAFLDFVMEKVGCLDESLAGGVVRHNGRIQTTFCNLLYAEQLGFEEVTHFNKCSRNANKAPKKTFEKPIWRNNKKRSVVLRLKLPTIKVGELDLNII